MFHYKITLNRVHDLIEVREGTESLVLRVDADPMDIVRIITKLEPKLNMIQSNEEAKAEAESIGHEFCNVIFGRIQTSKLFEFYNNDALAVLDIISKYLSERLVMKVAKVQKRAKI